MTSALRLGDAQVDLEERQIRRSDRTEPMTPLEATFLRFLAAHRGRTVARAQLLTEVWGYSPRTVTRAVDNTVSRLRRKIEQHPARPRWLTSTRSGGYRLEREPTQLPPLPEEPSSFVGREDELGQVLDALDRGPAVVVTGLGGIGKSRVALRVARRWCEAPGREAMVVRLRGAAGEEVLGRIGAQLRVGAAEVPDALEGRDELLCVLDEVERLSDDDLAWIEGVVGPRFLLTSQRPLGLRAEVVELGPMARLDASFLLTTRAQVAVDADAVDRVVDALSGVPFALELAARWLAAASPDELIERLTRVRDRIGAGSVGVALEGSWELLGEDQRSLLGSAALFAGTFSIADLEALTGRADVLEPVADLVARGWLHRTAAGLTVYTVVREFLAARAPLPPDGARRHAQWLLSWAPEARLALRGRWDPATLARLQAAELDLRQAVRAATDPDTAVPLLLVLHRSFGGSVPMDLARAEVDRVRGLLPPGSPWTAEVELLRGTLAYFGGDTTGGEEALTAARAALPTSREPVRLEGAIDGVTASVLADTGRVPEAIEHLRRGVARMTDLGERLGAGVFRMNLGVFVGRSDPDAGTALLVQAMAEVAVCGDPGTLGRIHANLGRLASDPAVTAQHLDRAEALLREADERRALGQVLSNRAMQANHRGDVAAARAAAEEARDLLRRLGVRRSVAITTMTLAEAALQEGHAAAALELALTAREEARRCDALDVRAEAEAVIGLAELSLGRAHRAVSALRESIDASRRSRQPDEWVRAGLALALLAGGDDALGTAELAAVDGPYGELVRAGVAGLPEPFPARFWDDRVLFRLARRVRPPGS